MSSLVASLLLAWGVLVSSSEAANKTLPGDNQFSNYFWFDGFAYDVPAPVRFIQESDWNGTEIESTFTTADVLYQPALVPNLQRAFESIIWESDVADTVRVNQLLGVTTNGLHLPGQYAPTQRMVETTSFTLRDMDLTFASVGMRLFTDTPTLSLDNSTLHFDEGAMPATFTETTATLDITATGSAASTLRQMDVKVPGAVNIDVAAGNTLRFLESGANNGVAQGVDQDTRLWFEGTGSAATVAGTLQIEKSGVLFETTEQAGGITVENGGTLQLLGDNPVLFTNYLTVNDGGTLALGNSSFLWGFKNTTLELDPVDRLTLAGGTVNVAAGGQFMVDAINASGSSDIVVQGAGASILYSKFNSIVMADASTSVTLRGTNTANVYVGTEGVTAPSPLWLFNGGTLTIAEGAAGESFTLNVGQERQGQAPGLISLEPSDANIVVEGANATLFIGENATFTKRPDSNCTITLNNGGKLKVGGLGKLVGSGTISGAVAGSALVEVEAGGELGVDNVLAFSSAHDLHVQTDFSMGDSATLSLGVLPSITAADTLTVDGELALANATQLNLYVEAANDATLPLGTTLLLIDYSDTYGYQGRFSNRRDNSIFTLGLNTYQIKYSDPTWAGGTNPSVMTLTVVPEPSSLALLAVGAVGSVAVMRRRRRKASSLAAAA
jgi:hypothetical protein